MAICQLPNVTDVLLLFPIKYPQQRPLTTKWAEKHKAKKELNSLGQDSTMVAINFLTLLEEKIVSRAIAQIMNISPKEVSKIVKGKVNFSIELISHLEKAFGQKIMQI